MPDAVVDHRDSDSAVVARDRHAVGPSRSGRVSGVDQQVDEDLLERGRVGDD